MSSRAAQIRSDLGDSIDTHKTAADYTETDFDIEESHVPLDKLPALNTAKVWLTDMGGDEANETRSQVWYGELGIQVACKKQVDLDDASAVDSLVLFLDELKQTARELAGSGSVTFDGTTHGFNYSHLRNEVLKDPNGRPFAFGVLKEKGLFEGVFVAVYQITSD